MKCFGCSGNIQSNQTNTGIREACQFSLDTLKYVYPEEITTDGRTPQEELTMLTWRGAKEQFGDVIPEKQLQRSNMNWNSLRR
jgi:hypothetical protein